MALARRWCCCTASGIAGRPGGRGWAGGHPAGACSPAPGGGRALIYSAIVRRPSRMSPEQAQGDMAAFLASRDALEVILAGMTPFTGRVPTGVPVTIGWGTRDRLLPPRQILVAKARVPEARLVPLPGCGHAPMTDDPDLVADVLLRGSGRTQSAGDRLRELC